MRQKIPSSFAYYQKPRYSMPPNFSTSPVNYQLVPIRHSMSFNRSTPVRSLNTFTSNRAMDDNSRFGSLLRNVEERRSPYYYNELTRMHASTNNNNNSSQFIPISNGNLNNDENFIDFINTIHPE